jgi:hypothetical protein
LFFHSQLYFTNELCIIRKIQYSNDKRSYAYHAFKNKQMVDTPSTLDTQSHFSSNCWASRKFCFLTVLVKPSGTARFYIQQFYVLPTQLCLCVLCGSQNKQPLFPYTTLNDWFL